ncbi:hypothetical protein IC762_29300 [Bradyrhizobium genosp. L]|uniref:hypothetical protein n=1 Tax=Bradyrhizobium genosp. L TaxID=83637 RepID=UPI0018A2B8B4|nr:hypothetical protein [Bradyrhizobium genosp. L]QPF83755.1 hypothetical protein IC762_29300 [Bradyrhizobium genosp. L]
MPHRSTLLVALAICAAAFSAATPARAQDSDRALLATFCAAANVKGSACSRARSYPNAAGRACNVKLTRERYAGRFLGPGNTLLAVNYESECEAHVNDFGGVALFEQRSGAYRFVRFLPGVQGHDCVVLPKDAGQDMLICTVGHMGQGALESAVARMAFTNKPGKGVAIAPDFLVRAEDDVGAFGANVVNCNEGPKYFGLSNLTAGPRPNTVAVDIDLADDETIRTACGKGFPKLDELYHELQSGEAFVPEGYGKKQRFTIDLVTRKVAPSQ